MSDLNLPQAPAPTPRVNYAAVERVKRRLKKADAIEAAIVNQVLNDLRKMVRT